VKEYIKIGNEQLLEPKIEIFNRITNRQRSGNEFTLSKSILDFVENTPLI